MPNSSDVRGESQFQTASTKLLLDGQQRITTLYGIIRGEPPPFFDGDSQAFTGLRFNLESETFEFYAPVKMAADPFWIDVTNLMQNNIGEYVQLLNEIPEARSNLNTYINRLTDLYSIRDVDLHIEEVAGSDKTVDVVVDIFNRVNSGGTKLSKGDLALAKICADWSDARREMRTRLDIWKRHGFNFQLDWLLRNITTVLTGEALFTHLGEVSINQFQQGLLQSEKAINMFLNLFAARLGLDHDRVLGSRYSFPLLARYLVARGGQLPDHAEINKILYWYIHCSLWGRYAGSTESFLNQDLAAVEQDENAPDRLIELLRTNRGDLRLNQNDFQGWSRSSRFYPLLYLLTRVHHAKDWNTGIELSSNLLGRTSRLEIHHIFPKSLLYKHGYTKAEVNAVANFTFLTQSTNLLVSNRDPAEYLEAFIQQNPGAVESHWIPMDKELWHIDRYRDFLAARRELLAQAANEFLDGLLAGHIGEPHLPSDILSGEIVVPGGISGEEEEELLLAVSEWMMGKGLPEGELLYELADAITGRELAVIDLAWPNGIQEGLSEPVALMINEERDAIQIVSHAGFRCFEDAESLKLYIETTIRSGDVLPV